MRTMDNLKLVALDAEDLIVISAHAQDAVLKAGDVSFWPREQRAALLVRRFDWEADAKARPRRRLAALQFGKVLKLQSLGLDPAQKERVLNLLGISFIPSGGNDDPSGEITLAFSDGAAVKLTVECIETQLTDLGPVWEAAGVPVHPVD